MVAMNVFLYLLAGEVLPSIGLFKLLEAFDIEVILLD
jgi:hypothetical protein